MVLNPVIYQFDLFKRTSEVKLPKVVGTYCIYDESFKILKSDMRYINICTTESSTLCNGEEFKLLKRKQSNDSKLDAVKLERYLCFFRQ